MNEARLVERDGGLVPEGDGWFVVNAREARWGYLEGLGAYLPFEGPGEGRFPQLGVNVSVLPPGDRMAMYHHEPAQENFLVLSGEAILVVEGQEHPLKAWDFVHCPPNTAHVVVAAGDRPCVVLAVGARGEEGGSYPVDEAALRHGAGVEVETDSPAEAYARFGELEWGPYRDGLLP